MFCSSKICIVPTLDLAMVRTGTPSLLGDVRFPSTEITVTGQNIPVQYPVPVQYQLYSIECFFSKERHCVFLVQYFMVVYVLLETSYNKQYFINFYE
jgi:hypothetical protein